MRIAHGGNTDILRILELYFCTDHHSKPTTGVFLVQFMCSEFRRKYQFTLMKMVLGHRQFLV